ncbi:hypothetical protein I79_008779 [Cricetulus griseus]|uniref:Uncharacterized protein n=1 Tax=Cricetulus griseus TaxID=10029 RepID=G3HE10_CRIGR|nr:hypothetical protein I79_008779 [Cricetulus griseus]
MWPWPGLFFLLSQPCAEAVHRETLSSIYLSSCSVYASLPRVPGRPLRPSEELLQLFSSDC